MKKTIAMIALAAICLGTVSVSASTPVKMSRDTVKKMKMKKKTTKMKMKKKVKDTTKM